MSGEIAVLHILNGVQVFKDCPGEVDPTVPVSSRSLSILIYTSNARFGGLDRSCHRRWVTFTGEIGDLEPITAFPYSWEVQSILTHGGDPTPLGGSFSVEFGGYGSEALPYDASADGLKAALEALPGTGRVQVDKIVLENGKNEWLVTFRYHE